MKENKIYKGKLRHKWTKEISEIKFNGKFRDGEGNVIWKNRKELILLRGAKLSPNPQINKDGSINFSAKFAEMLRLEHKDKIKNNITIEDIIFPSPNMLGLFLFYGGQNTWEVLKDSNGKTLDEWSKIE